MDGVVAEGVEKGCEGHGGVSLHCRPCGVRCGRAEGGSEKGGKRRRGAPPWQRTEVV